MDNGDKKIARILIVDDEERNRKLLEALLAPMGYELDMAGDGEEALERVAAEGPDLILLDIMMPKIDGFGVLQTLREDRRYRGIPVVMLTALNDTESRVRAFDLGVDDFVSKPAERTELMARVRSLLKVKAYNDQQKCYQQDLEQEVARITEQLHQAYQDIKNTSLDTVYRLSQAAEYKDESTGAHIERVSLYSSAIASKMGLANRMVETLLYAAPMHDLGKIGIPDEILLKAGKLDDEEWSIMKQHCRIGSNILRGTTSEFLKVGEEVARTHHERWDGAGYPEGLKGGEIPLPGRITAVADVFDALTSKRPYREPLTMDHAFDYIRDESGGHFDPAVVSAFFVIQKEIVRIRQTHRDHTEVF